MFWWIFATLVAFFVKGLCGFANTLVFSAILSFGSSNINITPVELLLGFPTNLILAWKERKSIRWKLCLPLIVLILAGNIPGIFLLKNTDSRSVKIFFGLVIMGIGVEMLLRERHPHKGKESRLVLILVGIMSGILSGMYGIGAMLAAYVSQVTEDSHSFKANMCAVFLAENLFRIPMYTATGILTPVALKQAALLFLVMLAGLFAGMKSSSLLDEKAVKTLVIFMLILSGAALVLGEVLAGG
ncbi:MAG: sulfite exporter TauE/SafE family protein [Lachnospiraceae bacterium]|nr:sulfite exporter TauE/SafE family protein [Lachnospiraceae bacterium]